MSLAINIDDVTAVLIKGSDGWETVAPMGDKPEISSFTLDSYEFVDSYDELLMGGGSERQFGVSATGFGFTTPAGERISGPISSILAVKHRR